MTHGSAARRGLVTGFLLALTLLPQVLPARDVPDPFAYTWKIVYKDKEIGHARSFFSYRTIGGDFFLTEEGVRAFSVRFGGIPIAFSEKTSVVWNRDGLMETYVSRSTIGSHTEERRAERRADGAVVHKKTTDNEIAEEVFPPGEFDYTDADRFITRLCHGTDPRTLRILSLGNKEIVSFTYRFMGRETIRVNDKAIEVSRVAVEGPNGEGILLVDDLGIAVSLTMETSFGDFSFVLTGQE
jgi:hypothetical protein